MTPSLILDLFLISLVLFLAIRSAIIGFLDELFGVGPFVLGAYLGLMFMHLLKPYVAKCMNQTLASVVSFLLIFSVVFLVMKIIQTIFFCRQSPSNTLYTLAAAITIIILINISSLTQSY